MASQVRTTRRTRIAAAPLAAVVAALVISGPAGAATPLAGPSLEPSPTVGTTSQGIIMSDGRICNPRWGC